MVLGVVIVCGGTTTKIGTEAPGCGAGGGIFKGGSPDLCSGRTILCCTSSIQNVADIWAAFALALVAWASPWRKAMLAVPPPTSGAVGFVETVKTVVLVMVFPLLAVRNTLFGSSRMAWVMVPSAMNLLRSCGSLGVSVADAFWLANGTLLLRLPITNGVMSTLGMVGGPAMLEVGARHWALMVVPCGMDAIRVSDSPRTGSTVVAGTCILNHG